MHPQSTPSPAKRAAIYCRVSTLSQEDNYSLASQLDQCQAYAEREGYSVSPEHVYREIRSSFSLDRPQLTELRAALRRGEIDVILVNAFDRWTSDRKDLYRLYDDLEEGEAELESVTEGVFQDTAIGRMVMDARTLGRELWLEAHKERTQRGLRERTKSGKPRAGGAPIYGYRWRDEAKSGLEVYAPEAEIVRRIFHELVSGSTATALVKALTSEGVPAPGVRGQKPTALWSASTVGRIVRNQAYQGIAWDQKSRNVMKGRKRIRVEAIPEAERTRLPEGTIPALIDQETAAKALARLAHNRTYRQHPPPEGGYSFLVGYGTARCGICGHALTAVRRGDGRKPSYRCPSAYKADSAGYHKGLQILASELDEAVWERALLVRANGDYVRQHIEKLAQDDTTADELARMERSLKGIASQEANISRAIGMVQSPEAMAPLVSQLEHLGKTRQALAQEREALAQQAVTLERTRTALADFTSRAEQEIEALDHLTHEQRRDVLASLGVAVKVWPKGNPERYEITMAFDIDAWLDPAHYVENGAVEAGIAQDIASGQAPAPVYQGGSAVRADCNARRARP